MIFSFLISFLFASPNCLNNTAVNPDYPTLEKQIEQKIKTSSSLVTIASEADSVLSKLISNKSPILMNWLEKRELLSQKEEVIAREWRTYYLKNFIFSKYPTPKPKINTSVEKLFSDINHLSFPKQQQQYFEKIFQQAKKDSLQFIKTTNIEQSSKQEIISRIQGINLFWFKSLKGSRYQNKPLEFLKWGLAYDPPTNQINVGVFARKYASDETLYSVFAHEIGHAFDPCRWSAFFKTKNPFENLYQCLRSPKSSGALARDDSKMDFMIRKKLLNKEMADSLKAHPYCNRSFYPPVGTQKEQLLEVFADWFSAEVLASGSMPPKTMRTDLCSPKELSLGSSYLPNRERLKRIYYTQPLLKTKLKLKSSHIYCSL